jgi:hypothetical protein
MDATDVRHLRRAIELARLARVHGNQPFGSLLVSGAPCPELEADALAVHDGFWSLSPR